MWLRALAVAVTLTLGSEYGPLDDAQRTALDAAPGAALVVRVYGGSPAERAGIEPGDVILGPPGAPFTERNQLREWILTSIADEVRELQAVRGNTVRTLDLRIGVMPR